MPRSIEHRHKESSVLASMCSKRTQEQAVPFIHGFKEKKKISVLAPMHRAGTQEQAAPLL
eukprot:scaffold101906_cov20-Tisochrysis_lutea.AAC.1